MSDSLETAAARIAERARSQVVAAWVCRDGHIAVCQANGPAHGAHEHSRSVLAGIYTGVVAAADVVADLEVAGASQKQEKPGGAHGKATGRPKGLPRSQPTRALPGEKYGALEVVQEAPKRSRKRRVLCRCACGKEVNVQAEHLWHRKGPKRDCGCGAGKTKRDERTRSEALETPADRVPDTGEKVDDLEHAINQLQVMAGALYEVLEKLRALRKELA